MKEIKDVSVRWSDGYLEEFEAAEVRAGNDLLWMVLVNGQNRHIPLRTVRWFSITPNACPKDDHGCSSPNCMSIPMDNFINTRSQDISELAKELETYRHRASAGEDRFDRADDTKTEETVSQYAKHFNESCVQWSNNRDYNLAFLRAQQTYANDLFQHQGHVFLNEVYDLLGFSRTKSGAIVGWAKGKGDTHVDFGICDENCDELGILLDFNVSGVIYDCM